THRIANPKGNVNAMQANYMGTFRSKKKAETRMNAGLRPNQGVKVRAKREVKQPSRAACQPSRLRRQ
ncbi:MAG: hypothetical protein ACK58P_16645, partial [Betaproteobacteria bacterium]